MSNITRSVPSSWTLIERVPTGTSANAQAFADAERQLRYKFREVTNWGAAFEVRGDGILTVDFEGSHWFLNDRATAGLELRVLLMNASQPMAAVRFAIDGNRANMLWGRDFSAEFVRESADDRIYRVEKRFDGELVRKFKAILTASQKASARPSDVLMVEEWCKVCRDKLPQDGGQVSIDLGCVIKR
jgi:hypothetical protein